VKVKKGKESFTSTGGKSDNRKNVMSRDQKVNEYCKESRKKIGKGELVGCIRDEKEDGERIVCRSLSKCALWNQE